MLICPNCGASVHETAGICPSCGTAVPAPNMNQPGYPQQGQQYGQPGYPQQGQQFGQPGMPPQPYNQPDVSYEKAQGWEILVSILVPIVGLVFYFTNKDKRPVAAKTMLTCALIAWGASFALSIFFRIIAAVLTS